MNPGKGRSFTPRRKGAKEFKKLSDLATWREPIGVGALRWILLLLVLMPQPVAARPAAGAPSPDALAAFFDTRIPAQLAQYNIPGAAVAVVADGQVVFAQGYGYTNSETRAPVVAEKTLFHIGSVTKLFTWTAVMQLVEQGKLDLDADINTYLSAIQFPPTFSEPIRLKHLLTHTTGLEDRLSNLLRINRYDGLALEDYIVRQQPTRVWPPGELIGYSNYGGALGGYIVQEVSGISYEQYVEENIFAPLGMQRSSVRRPVAPELEADVSWGHVGGPVGVIPLIEYFPAAPMVGVSATVTDMAKFMIAQLQKGRYGDRRILAEETADMMQQQQFTHDPRLPGVTYGFVEWQRNGRRILWHSGSTPTFQGVLTLLPEDNVGIFVIYNRKSGRTEVGKLLRDEFLDTFYPVVIETPQPLAGYRERAQRFAGDYHESRWAYTTADRFIYMLTRYYDVTANPDGTIEFMGATYVETAPLFFHEVGGQGTLLFREDAQGRITHGFYDYDPHKVFIKLAWYETLDFHLTVMGACMVVFLAMVFVRLPGQANHHELRALLRWGSLTAVVYPPAMLFIGFSRIILPLPDVTFLAPLFVAALWLALGASLVGMALAWRRGVNRLHTTLLALALGVFMVWLQHWNLLALWHF
ncbi:MAG TPA: serine hydrolase domain-containing protein [Anaerolineae bacterium]|nr:serine hydrolase domain-containing protein [Anaerolineae bacterium]